MNAMSIRRDSRSPSPHSPPEGEGEGVRRPRTFLCREDLYRAFEGRAHALECSVDWLLGEAMKRLLADARLEVPPPMRLPSHVQAPPPLPPPPMPPPPIVMGRPPTGPMTTPMTRRPLPPSMMGPPLVPPPPAPPSRSRKNTSSFVGQRAAIGEPIALRLGDLRVVVDRDRFVIGRSAKDAHFPIKDGGVSRQHAIIERAPGGWVIVDMASTNGVLLNRARVTRAAIQAGDVLEIGPFAIVIERG